MAALLFNCSFTVGQLYMLLSLVCGQSFYGTILVQIVIITIMN